MISEFAVASRGWTKRVQPQRALMRNYDHDDHDAFSPL
jgi:hypothetical protein